MKPTRPAEQAVKHFADGYLCSQSVFMAYAEQLDVDRQIAARVASPFGAGIAYMGTTCGAVTGALMVLGVRYGHDDPEDEEAKERVLEKAQAFLSEFESLHGSLRCRELLGRDVSTDEGLDMARQENLFETRCPRFVEDAARLLGEILES